MSFFTIEESSFITNLSQVEDAWDIKHLGMYLYPYGRGPCEDIELYAVKTNIQNPYKGIKAWLWKVIALPSFIPEWVVTIPANNAVFTVGNGTLEEIREAIAPIEYRFFWEIENCQANKDLDAIGIELDWFPLDLDAEKCCCINKDDFSIQKGERLTYGDINEKAYLIQGMYEPENIEVGIMGMSRTLVVSTAMTERDYQSNVFVGPFEDVLQLPPVDNSTGRLSKSVDN
jgi:hypothetical protein